MTARFVQTDQAFRSLVPPLSAEERSQLEMSLRRDGCRDSLVVWKGPGILVDGHHRLEICTAHEIPFSTVEIELESRDAAKEWIIRNQFGRRNLTPFQKAELALKLEPLTKAQAEARMKAGRKPNPMQNSAQGPVRAELAHLAGVSHNTLDRVRYLSERADETTKDRLRRGETTINAEFTRMKTPERTLSSESVEYYTPALYVEAARRVLGDIDLDPASSDEANKIVRAGRYYTEGDDGLAHDWPGRLWLNPPYCGQAGKFTGRLVQQYEDGITEAAILLVNANSTETEWFRPLWDYVLCFVYGRINYYSPTKSKNGTTHGSVFVYLGPNADRFQAVFSEIGAVVTRRGMTAASRDQESGHESEAVMP